MDAQQFDDISEELQLLHKSMKNILDIVFATSPLLALSTHGWNSRWTSIHSTYLLRVSDSSLVPSLIIDFNCLRSFWRWVTTAHQFWSSSRTVSSKPSSIFLQES